MNVPIPQGSPLRFSGLKVKAMDNSRTLLKIIVIVLAVAALMLICYLEMKDKCTDRHDGDAPVQELVEDTDDTVQVLFSEDNEI